MKKLFLGLLISLNVQAGYLSEEAKISNFCQSTYADSSKMITDPTTKFTTLTESFKEQLKTDKVVAKYFVICINRKMFDDAFSQYAQTDYEKTLNIKIDDAKKVLIKKMISVLVYQDETTSMYNLSVGPFKDILDYYTKNVSTIKQNLQLSLKSKK